VTESIRVLLVDDHALVRDSLSHRLQSEADLDVVATLSQADEVLGQVRALAPHVVVLDIDMPGRSSFDVAREVIEQHPEVRVLYLSAFHHDRYIEDALAAGAGGYLTKDEPPEILARAIRQLAAGGAYFSERVRGRLRIDSDGNARLTEARPTRVSSLTPRELEVLRYLARGMSKKEIAAALKRSYSTVDRHTENLMGKLDIHDRVELARFAIREGLAEP
jgi:DNA-binding NarL/FixJ family response regulator